MIEKVTIENFDDVLPLIRAYQAFYHVDNIQDDKNRCYFLQFVENNDQGALHLLRFEGQAIGFSTIYKGFSSARAEAVAILNDLYIQPQYRGRGFGRRLLNHAIKHAKNMGYQRLQWLTAQDNLQAQQLYDNMHAHKSAWFFYAVETN